MSRFPYQLFDEYVFRTPLFSRKKFQKITDNDEISDIELRDIYTDPVFQEAIYLASPYLHGMLNELLNSEKKITSQKIQKLKNSFLKYYSRMSTRSIPFGLFTMVGLGNFNRDTSGLFDDLSTENLCRDTKLDMHFLVGLSQYLTKIPEVRNQLLFYPNNSIYKTGNRARYVEYEYTNGKRDFIVSSALLSGELSALLDFSKEGKTIPQIINILINEEITKEEAGEFVEELIDNQVLLSELEPNVSGIDFLEILITALKRIGAVKEAEILFSIKTILINLDKRVGNPVLDYQKIEKLIQTIFIGHEQNQFEYDQKYLFQTDLYFRNNFTLTPQWKKELKNAVIFLNKVTLPRKDTHIDRFKKQFYERFETEEVALAYVLDTEIGIGYKQGNPAKGVHPYLEDLKLPLSREKQDLKIQLNSFQLVLNEKLQQNLYVNNYCIELFDEDFKEFEERWDDLPDTISFMTEIISLKNREKLFMDIGGGSSAANLIARFCSEKSQIQNLTKIITRKEEELNQDYILAEIIHLPEARIGNVIRRPTLREYEIPYLSQSILTKEHQIPIDDLYISLKNNKIMLRSKRLNKEVKPYLTNAHNYSANPLPVYHFLCDLYSQNSRPGLYFDWGDLKDIYHFLPRIEYKNIILSKAWWRVTEKEFAKFSIWENYDNDNKKELLSELRTWRNKRQIPQWIQWVQSDNKLTINLENYDLVKIFMDTIKKLNTIIIEEFLYNENSDFTNQFIFSMYNREKERRAVNVLNND